MGKKTSQRDPALVGDSNRFAPENDRRGAELDCAELERAELERGELECGEASVTDRLYRSAGTISIESIRSAAVPGGCPIVAPSEDQPVSWAPVQFGRGRGDSPYPLPQSPKPHGFSS